MKRFILAPIVALCLLAAPALADDPKPADAVTAADAAKPADTAKPEVKSDDPVADAEKPIDGATETIDNDPGAAVNQLIQLAKEGRWGPFVGLLVMFLIWALRKFIWKLIPKNVLPWVTLGAGMLATGAIELGLGVTWWKVLIDAFATSGIAMGFWSLLFKHFMKPKEA
jgi:hypothetical protein